MNSSSLAYQRALLEKDLLSFTCYFFNRQFNKNFILNWHHEKICDALEKIASGEIKRLVINIPPRYSKSLIAKMFVAWGFAKNPASNFIYTSYSHDLVLGFSGEIRELLKLPDYKKFWDIKIKEDANTKKIWKTTAQGGFYAVSTGGSITGFGAGVMEDEFGGALIIDDPNNTSHSESDILRERAIMYYTNTLRSRLNHKNTPIILIMQRLHEEDLTGFLLRDDNKEKWHLLKIPILNEKNEPLWPFKHDLEAIQILKNDARNKAVFAGQYMQTPMVLGGNIIKEFWFRDYEVLPKLKYKQIFADTAMKTKRMNDYSVFQCWGMGENGNAYLIDQMRGKWEAPDLIRKCVGFWNKHLNTGNGTLRNIVVEDKASGTGLIQTLRRDHHIPVKEIKPDKDKVARVQDVVGWIEGGYVYIPKQRAFISDLLYECSIFPNGKHDDQVDVVAYALYSMFVKRPKRPKVWGIL
jgi:predicted phage terminase large subunit-like protein